MIPAQEVVPFSRPYPLSRQRDGTGQSNLVLSQDSLLSDFPLVLLSGSLI